MREGVEKRMRNRMGIHTDTTTHTQVPLPIKLQVTPIQTYILQRKAETIMRVKEIPKK